jgi:uncharacterized protein YnzC (UPF0291/DUF896 family)
MTAELEQTETAILSRAINPAQASLTPEAAQSILDIKLTESDVARRDELADKAREGTLTPEELNQLESYRHVGRILELMKAKARISLQKAKIAS